MYHILTFEAFYIVLASDLKASDGMYDEFSRL